ncbi:tight junction protein ZO-1 isoform X2 [Daktulosphaira vitifoliae]|uniref:tight junction protein ZO-1 isoform X2 n=1 Tax=Daktulosphaira vitifoliae TaxID=58002 RepID=UPI0021A9E35D|nr:tight junction protein ZO-1 isoform X2 [Daktulosphaira vitifoliae]
MVKDEEMRYMDSDDQESVGGQRMSNSRSKSSSRSTTPPPSFAECQQRMSGNLEPPQHEEGSEMFEEPVEEMNGDRIVWEFHQVTLNRVPGYGFGIAVSGGRDNPHFANGDPSIAVSDVLKSGPAEGKLMVNDRIMTANGVSLDNVEYGTAVAVLRECGESVTLSLRRRLVLPSNTPHTLRIYLNKTRKKDDFGLVLGSRIYIKEGTKGDNSVQEGDVLLKINNQTITDGMTLKEVKRMIESAKDKISLTIRREGSANGNLHYSGSSEPTSLHTKENNNYMEGINGSAYPSQNLYVQPPSRNMLDEAKSNLVPRGRSRNPLLDSVSLSQLDRPTSAMNNNTTVNSSLHNGDLGPTYGRSRSGTEDHSEPPRPPPPRPEDYYSTTRQFYDETLPHRSKHINPDPRFITFQKEGSVGIRLTGGNEVGIFVTAVQPGSPAFAQGLQPGDKILKVNDMDMKGVTREEAVLFLLSLQDQIHLIVQHRLDQYEQIMNNQRGDSFHIKTHFDYEQPNKGEMSFCKGDVFHVMDTLHNGVVGSWQVFRIGRNNQEVQKGIIPNKARAEELATAQFNATKKEMNASENKGGFFRRRKHNHRRSKSLSKENWDDVVFGDSISKFPAYEKVVLNHTGFVRPVVLFGPISDIAREKLSKDFPDKFLSPQLENNNTDGAKKMSGIIRLSAIRDIMDRGKHALLDVTPNAVDRLNYAQFYPIVILLRAENKQIVKELRAGLPKTAHKSSKKLLEQCQKLEKAWSHVFTSTLTLNGGDAWYRKLRELIDKHQSSPTWVSETKPEENLSDDLLFPMTSLRLSYASSPESDMETSNTTFASPTSNSASSPSAIGSRLVKSSSDPSITTQDDSAIPNYNPPPPYSPSVFKQASYEPPQALRMAGPPTHTTLMVNGNNAPDLPPRVDRNNKPMQFNRVNGQRSATDRLFSPNDDIPNYINATPHHQRTHTSTSKQLYDMHNSYDSVSSYDSYGVRMNGFSNGNNNLTSNIVSNSQDDLKPGSNNTLGRGHHDPYRFTRSTQQPVDTKISDYPKYRPPGGTSGGIIEYATSKPLPLPKSPHQQSYKPVPPPKPKNYRPPIQQQQQYYQPPLPPTNGFQHSKSFSVADSTYSSHLSNGMPSSPSKYSSESTDVNTADSGHGSSLDRGYERRSNGQHSSQQMERNHSMYYKHNRDPNTLDLTQHRDQRGSAFELYKKPSSGDHRLSNGGSHYNVDALR